MWSTFRTTMLKTLFLQSFYCHSEPGRGTGYFYIISLTELCWRVCYKSFTVIIWHSKYCCYYQTDNASLSICLSQRFTAHIISTESIQGSNMRLHWSASLAFSHGREKEPFGNPMIGELFEMLVSSRLKIENIAIWPRILKILSSNI